MRNDKKSGWWALVDRPCDSADLRYISSFNARDPVACAGNGRQVHLVVPDMEFNRARRSNKRLTIWTPSLLGIKDINDRHNPAQWLHYLLKQLHVRAITVNGFFPVGAAGLLKKRGIKIEVCKKAALFDQRLVKSKCEMRNIRLAQRAAAAAMRKAVETIRNTEITASGELLSDGHRLTSRMLQQLIRVELIKHDCEAPDVIAAGGRQSADPHQQGTGGLRAGQPIVLDIFPRHALSGYWGDMTRTVCRGRAPDEVTRMWRAVRAAQRKAIEHIRPGVNARTLYTLAREHLEKSGFQTSRSSAHAEGFVHGLGHGVGLDIHEAPSVGTASCVLKRGMVITIEPGLYYRKLGGVRIEDTVEITANGARLLAACPYEWEL